MIDFITILHAACSQTNSVEEMDTFLNDTLEDVTPYDSVFGKKEEII